MTKLIINELDFSLNASNYHILNDLICVESTLNNSELKLFIELYKSHLTDEESFDFMFDNKKYYGRFGRFVFDSKGKIQLFLTIKPFVIDENTYTYSSVTRNEVEYYNTSKVLVDLEKRFNYLINLLKKKELINEDETDIFSGYLTSYEEGIKIKIEVADLDEYLKETHETIED
ncbi:hypothetical protein MMB88_002914, partial [Listeria innocua]|nr:hypothetical protein [Listeria innocua]